MKLALHWQILIALALAAFMGSLTGATAEILGVSWLAIYDFIGALFLNALKMIVVPLVVSAIIIGVSNIGGQGGFSRLGSKTIGFYLFTGLIAVVVGLVVINSIQPGIGHNQVPQIETNTQLMSAIEGKDAGDVVQVFLRMVPENIFKAAAEMQMLGLIFFAGVDIFQHFVWLFYDAAHRANT